MQLFAEIIEENRIPKNFDWKVVVKVAIVDPVRYEIYSYISRTLPSEHGDGRIRETDKT